MPIKVEGGWKCSICGKVHSRDMNAISCEQSHDIVYVPFTKPELFNLIQFIYSRDESLLTPELVKKIVKYRKNLRQKKPTE